MPRSNDFSIALLKVLVAMGWADGELSAPERELIRACMDAFYLNEQQRNYFQYYFDNPTTPQQAELFSRALVESVTSGAERQEALDRLQQLVQADRRVEEPERLLLERLHVLFDDTGDLGLLLNRLRGFFAVRPFGVRRSSDALLAELEAELFWLWRERDYQPTTLSANLKEGKPATARQRTLAFVGALAGCTWAELREPVPPTTGCIRETLKLKEEEARFVEQFLLDPYVRSLDRSRLVRGVEDFAERELAEGLVDLLFCLAASDGTVSDEETETIRGMALGLKVTHRVFIASKLRYAKS